MWKRGRKNAMGTPLFGARIEPDCRYCANGKKSRDGLYILCCEKGVLSLDSACSDFSYDPFLRVPLRAPVLPQFDPQDFQIL